jgi:hypothetical protein
MIGTLQTTNGKWGDGTHYPVPVVNVFHGMANSSFLSGPVTITSLEIMLTPS